MENLCVGDEVVSGSSMQIMKLMSIEDGLAVCEWQQRGQSMRQVFPVGELKKKQPLGVPDFIGRGNVPSRADFEGRHFIPKS